MGKDGGIFATGNICYCFDEGMGGDVYVGDNLGFATLLAEIECVSISTTTGHIHATVKCMAIFALLA